MMDRSYLFVPGNRPERFDKAYAAGAHAVIVDLEDAVAPADKAAARKAARAWLTAEKPVWLRINGPESEWFSSDLDLVALAGVKGVMLPKAEDTVAIAEIRGRVRAGARIIPLIESALGLWRAEAIACAEGVERLAFGSVDFQLDTGIAGEREELLFARSQLVLVSRVAGRGPSRTGGRRDGRSRRRGRAARGRGARAAPRFRGQALHSPEAGGGRERGLSRPRRGPRVGASRSRGGRCRCQ